MRVAPNLYAGSIVGEGRKGRRRGLNARVGSGVAARWQRKNVREGSSSPREMAAMMTPSNPRKCKDGSNH
jgi:hypothetical protein